MEDLKRPVAVIGPRGPRRIVLSGIAEWTSGPPARHLYSMKSPFTKEIASSNLIAMSALPLPSRSP